MKMLAACEYSGIVREAFAAKGWEAWSCDILTTEQPSERHFKGSVLELFDEQAKKITCKFYDIPEEFDLVIAFPPCTYLTYAGMANWYDAGRAEKRIAAADFFMKMYNAPAKYVAVENPQGIMSKIFRKPDQVIHPYHFGEPEMKRTYLWLRNLPPLVWKYEDDLFNKATATEKPEPVMCYTRKSDGRKMKQYGAWGVNNIGFMDGKKRSKTFQSIATAMAEQWTEYILNDK
ncbi:MAG: DNA cytosine methyltransferase [Bacteroidetes bacterium]|nr:DNA cytosine methyltransferase [Bacteroidota bacterium]